MPRHPTLKSAPLHPDGLATAAVTPNVQRAPKLSKWTSSTHVVQQIGSSSGLNTFHIEPVLDSEFINVKTEDQEVADKLVFDNREDVRHMWSNKRFSSYVDDLDFKYKDKKISDEVMGEALKGSTGVTCEDAYEHWKNLENRRLTKIKSDTLCFDYNQWLQSQPNLNEDDFRLLPPKAKPFLNNINLTSTESCLLDILIVMQKYSSKIHFAFRRDPKTEGIVFLLTKLFDLCQPDLKIKRDHTFKKLFDDFQLFLDENDIANDEEGLFDLFCKIAQEIEEIVVFPNFDDVNEDVDLTGKIVIITDSTDHFQLVHEWAKTLPNHYLQGSYFNGECTIRWLDHFPFEKHLFNTRRAVIEETKAFLFCPIINDDIFRDITNSMTIRFDNVKCGFHNESLVRVTRNNKFTCGFESQGVKCTNQVSAQCLGAGPPSACPVGLCLKHARHLQNSPEIIEVHGQMEILRFDNVKCGFHSESLLRIKTNNRFTCGFVTNGVHCTNVISVKCMAARPSSSCRVGLCSRHATQFEDLPQTMEVNCEMVAVGNNPNVEEHLPVGDNENLDEHLHEENLDLYEIGNESNFDDRHFFDRACGANFDDEEDYFPGPILRRDKLPFHNIGSSMPSQYFLNDILHILKRPQQFFAHVPHPILSSIVSNCNEEPVMGLFPEAMLFPSLFWKYDKTVKSFPGALPSFLFFEGGGRRGVQAQFANLKEHLRVRCRDFQLLTSRTPAYLHFIFDILVNKLCEHTTVQYIIQRGLEFVNQIHDPLGSSTETTLSFDEETSSKKKKELSHLMRNCKWQYFFTSTCNDQLTPGVCEITSQLMKLAQGNDEKLLSLTQEYQSLLLDQWYRTVRFMMDHFVNTKKGPFGTVTAYFLRFEFQGVGAKANKPHIHVGLCVEEEAEEESLQRICCILDSMFSSSFGTDEEALRKAKLIDDDFDFLDIQTIKNFHIHQCDGAKRCKKRKADGTEQCRFSVNPHGDEYFYERLEPFQVDEELKEILIKLNLASEKDDGTLEYEKFLQSGKWKYPAQGFKEMAIPTIPFVAASMKSSTNVQMCDERFQVNSCKRYFSRFITHNYVPNRKVIKYVINLIIIFRSLTLSSI